MGIRGLSSYFNNRESFFKPYRYIACPLIEFDFTYYKGINITGFQQSLRLTKLIALVLNALLQFAICNSVFPFSFNKTTMILF